MKPELKRFYSVTDIVENNENNFKLTMGYYDPGLVELEGDESVLYLLALLDGTHEIDEIIEVMKRKYSNLKTQDIKEAIDYLFDMGMIENHDKYVESTLQPDEISRYDRHLLFYSIFSQDNLSIQQKLKDSKIALIGMGGIGCWTAYALAGAGVGTIVGVDHDIIESSNLTRQILFTENDIGKHKVNVAKERVELYNSFVKFIPINKRISSSKDLEEVIEGCDFVILSADKPREIHRWINEACLNKNIPYSNVGYINHYGVCGPLIDPNKYNKKFTAEIDSELNNSPSQVHPYVKQINDRYQAPSFGPLNGFVSCYQVLEVLKFLSKLAEPTTINRRFTINVYTMETSFQEFTF